MRREKQAALESKLNGGQLKQDKEDSVEGLSKGNLEIIGVENCKKLIDNQKE